MTYAKRTIVGLGEVLWDLLPDGKQLGGAPANFAYHVTALGNCGIVASRVGADAYGNEILERLRQLSVIASEVQVDDARPTGIVQVEIDSAGQPSYYIVENVAWDHLAWTAAWQELATRADAVCWGTLAQRSAASRRTINNFLRAVHSRALLIFDVNLRQPFYSPEVIADSLQLAHVVKLNSDELQIIARILDLSALSSTEVPRSTADLHLARELRQRYDLRLVCVTRGAGGSILVSPREIVEHPGTPTHVIDTIGAGDAFTALLAHGYLRGWSLERINHAANRYGAFVASQRGATPKITAELLSEVTGNSS